MGWGFGYQGLRVCGSATVAGALCIMKQPAERNGYLELKCLGARLRV